MVRQLKLFENRHEVMILTKEDVNIDFKGDFLVRAKDVAKVLEYAQAKDFTKLINPKYIKLVKNSDFAKYENRKSLNNAGEIFISSLGLNQGLANSKMPKAEPFQDWLFEEVLSSIQKHGMYAIDELLDNPDFMIQALQELKEEREARKQLKAESLMLQQQVEAQEPKVKYFESVLSSDGAVTTTQIAKDYGLSAQKLNKILREAKVQFKQNGQWLLSCKYHDAGYAKSGTFKFKRKGDNEGSVMNTRWTQKGRSFIHELLVERGVAPAVYNAKE